MFKNSKEALNSMKALFEKRMNAKLKRVEKAIVAFENFYTTIKENVKTATFSEGIKFRDSLIEFEFEDTRFPGKFFKFVCDLDGDRDAIHTEIHEFVNDCMIWNFCGKSDVKADPIATVNDMVESISAKE